MATGTQTDAGRGAARVAEDLTQGGRTQAQAVWNEASESARSALTGQQRAAAESIHHFADALRGAARQLDGEPTMARFAQHAADGLERISGTLQSKDLNSLMREAESFARSQPALFLGAAVAAGFLAMRFLKSSSPHPEAPAAQARRDLPVPGTGTEPLAGGGPRPGPL
jgi:hypothetical protein